MVVFSFEFSVFIVVKNFKGKKNYYYNYFILEMFFFLLCE